ncbi:MAG: putative toxin-antitoxin system toxin component, PIN family [Chitinophagaceae bacterium]|nr:putative toxin-antitoxin system toxin component, PIN family [Chitinophagaceae bacterium]
MNKFIIDTNLLVSAFLFPVSVPRQTFDKAVQQGRIVASTDTFDEFAEVFSRPGFEKYVPDESRQKLITDLKQVIVFETVSVQITDCRAPKDNKFLELAVTANASCIITGDNDLLVLHPYRGIPIINATDFLNTF